MFRLSSIYRDKKIVRQFVLAFSICVLGGISPVMAQHGAVDDVQVSPRTLQVSLGHALHHKHVYERSLFDRSVLQSFYQARKKKPYWVTDNGPTDGARFLFERIEDSWSHGLNPYHYHVDEIRALWNMNDMRKKADLELLLSDAFVRYVRDMSGMRVSAAALNLDAGHWKGRLQAAHALEFLDKDADMRRVLNSIEPSGATYKKLRKKLVSLVESMPSDAHKVQKIVLNGLLRPGNSHRSIVQFRDRLGLRQPVRGKYSYDDELAAAVIAFQRDNGLKPDGVIGSQTVDMLNKTHEDQIYQIIANMERFRWVDLKGNTRFVVVNIPSATLWALDEGQVRLEMPVIVGKPARATRSFVTEIEGVRFNPTWTVPPTIKRNDILPKLQQDVRYLSDKGIELYQGYGDAARSLDPNHIDWEGISWRELNDIRMVQVPGDHNALGRYRVLMPNKHNIYLHDTNHPEYFAQPNRALSSGCVRLSEPAKMAEYIMSASNGWGQEHIQSIVGTGRKTDVEIADPIPVYILYYTAWTGDNGEIVLGSDIYKQDKKLIKLLQDIDGFYIPRQNG